MLSYIAEGLVLLFALAPAVTSEEPVTVVLQRRAGTADTDPVVTVNGKNIPLDSPFASQYAVAR